MTNNLLKKNNCIGYVYKISLTNSEEDDVCPPDEKCYIGITRNLISRIAQHKKEYNKNSVKTPLYDLIREKGGFDNFECDILFESYDISYEDLLEKEAEFIELDKYNHVGRLRNTGALADGLKSYLKEWRKKNPDYRKQYNEKNKHILKKHIICDCGGVYTKANPTTHKKTKRHLNYLSECDDKLLLELNGGIDENILID